MATINFLLQSNKNPARIYVRLRDGKEIDVKAKTKYVINPDKWDKQKQSVNKSARRDIEYLNLDTEIQNLKFELEIQYNSIKGNRVVNKDWLENIINPLADETIINEETLLIDYIEKYIEYKRNSVTPSTTKKSNVIKNMLLNYQKDRNKVIKINAVNLDFKTDFENYQVSKDYALNTISRAVKFYKTVCNFAKVNGIEISNQLDSIKTKSFKSNHIYLNLDDLDKINKIDESILTKTLIDIKDWLIISCYTGQRISDFLRFNKTMITQKKNNEGEIINLIEFTQTKTNKIMSIPILKEVQEILDKRNGEFPTSYSDAKYNLYIKDICNIAKIKDLSFGRIRTKDEKGNLLIEEKEFEKYKLVTSHIGRRSFATNYYGKIPTPFLMYITGHSTEQLFLTYIGKNNNDLALEIAKYF